MTIRFSRSTASTVAVPVTTFCLYTLGFFAVEAASPFFSLGLCEELGVDAEGVALLLGIPQIGERGGDSRYVAVLVTQADHVTAARLDHADIVFAIVILLAALGLCLLVAEGVDTSSAMGTIACMMNNIGLGFRAGGPAESFAFLPPFSKFISILWMLLGRLEFFAVLMLFVPSFWKTTKI